MIVIDGERGSGKSALAQEIGRRMDPAFSLGQVALSAREMLRLYGTLRRGQVAVYDESALGLLSRAFMSEEAIALVQAALIGRKLGITTVLAIPDLMLLDVAFRESILKYRITVESREEGQRGTAWVHVRQFSPRYHRSDRRGLYLDREWNPLRMGRPPGDAVLGPSIWHARTEPPGSLHCGRPRNWNDASAREGRSPGRRSERHSGRESPVDGSHETLGWVDDVSVGCERKYPIE